VSEDRGWRLLFFPLGALAFGGAAYALFAFGIGHAIVLVIVGALCILTPRLKDLIRLEFGVASVKAEMQQAVADARATVEQLHLLAAELGKQIVRSAQAEGRWGGRSRAARARVTADTADALRKVGMSEEAIRVVTEVERPFLHFDYANWVADSAKPPPAEHRGRWNEFFSEHNAGIGSEPSPEVLRQFVETLGQLSIETGERLKDYEHFHNTGQHRRPHVWFEGADE